MNLIDRVLELFYPTRCAFCHHLTRGGKKVCDYCLEHIPYTHGPEQSKTIRFCEKSIAPLFYQDEVRESLHRYKFGGLTAYSQIYGEFMAKCIDENTISCDIITWVPLSAKRLRSRGYDQARLLAEDVARRKGLPCVALLRKIKDNPAQSGTGSPEKRRANVQGVYVAANESFLRDHRILLVDDIMTTGATLSECARILKTAGAADVYAVAAAMTRVNKTER